MKHEHSSRPGRFRINLNGVLIGFLAIAGFFLLTEHRAHLLGILPYLLLLACPLLHFFHGGHGHGADREDHAKERDDHPASHEGKAP